MRSIWLIAIAPWVLALVGCAASQQEAKPTLQLGAASSEPTPASRGDYAVIPAEFESAVRNAEFAGRRLYEFDRAAEKATDALVAAGYLPHAPGRHAGWLVRPLGDGRYRVSYLSEQDGVTTAFAEADYSASVDSASNPVSLNPPRMLDPGEAAQARAIRTAQSSEFLRCVEKYNVVTMDTGVDDTAAIHVYLIPSRDKENFFPQGGFHDVTVSADGTSITNHYSQTKACLNATPATDKGKLEALMNSHLTSPTPTLFHVFMSLNYRMNLFTVTTQNKMLWMINGDRIKLVSNNINNKK